MLKEIRFTLDPILYLNKFATKSGLLFWENLAARCHRVLVALFALVCTQIPNFHLEVECRSVEDFMNLISR